MTPQKPPFHLIYASQKSKTNVIQIFSVAENWLSLEKQSYRHSSLLGWTVLKIIQCKGQWWKHF